jgi:hypothetical protein
MVERETFDVGYERIGAVVANAGLLSILEIAARLDVFRRFRQDDARLISGVWRDVS